MFPFVSILAQTQEELLEKLETAEQIDKAHIYNELARINLGRNPDAADEYAQMAGLLATEYNLKNELGLSYKHRGIVAYFKSNDTLASSFYEQALAIFRETQNLLEISNIYNNLANIYSDTRKYEMALEYYLKSLEIRERLNNTRLVIASYVNIGNLYMNTGELARADSVYSRGLELNRLVFPDKIIPQLLKELGSLSILLGDHQRAKNYLEEALAMAENEQNNRDLFSINNTLGNNYLQTGDYERAIDHYNRAFEAAKELNLKLQMAAILLNIGNTFAATEQPLRAMSYYKESNILFNDVNNYPGIKSTYLNIGVMFDRINEPDSSLAYYQKAVDLSDALDDLIFKAQTYNFLGNQHRSMGNFEVAIPIINKALEFAKTLNLPKEVAIATRNLATLYFDTDNFDLSEQYALESLELFKKQANLVEISNKLLTLSMIKENQNRHDLALEYYKEYSALKDSLTNASRMEQITAMQEQLNLAIKEQEIENKNLQLAQQELVVNRTRERFAYLVILAILVVVILLSWFSWYRLNQSRQKLLMEQKYIETEHRLLRSQMNPHFMFNALNSIQLFISEKDSKQAEMYLSKFAHLMRYYLDSSFTSNVLLKEEVDGLRLNIELEQLRMNNSFSYQIELSEDLEPEMTEIPPMLAQPFVENAVKHGLRTVEQNGFLLVRFESAINNSIKCIIEDNGIGREAASRLKRTGNGHASRGIDITTSRLKNIWKDDYTDDYLNITDLTDTQGNPSGTRVEILFPTN
jgi:tetratricopeptide (TPR) repeat protein